MGTPEAPTAQSGVDWHPRHIDRRTWLARRVSGSVIHVILMIVTVVCLLPFVWMLLSSFKTGGEILQQPPTFFPANPTLANYEEIVTKLRFELLFRNSAIVAIAHTGAQLFTSALAGYVLAKYRFFGKEVIFIGILATMMVPFSVVLVPLYFIVTRIELQDSLYGLILTGLYSSFGIFLLRQFIETIPDDLIDAARVDGAGEWWIFSRLIVPLSASALGALSIFVFLGSWDSFLWPLVLLTSRDNLTLPVGLAQLSRENWSRIDMAITGGTLTIVPVMIIYLFAHRHFIRGIALTGLKG